MKKYYLLSFFTFFVLSLQAQLVIDGQTYHVDTLKNHLVGPGSRYTSIRLTGPHKQNVFFLKTNLKNPYIQFKQTLGRDSIYGTERPSSIAQRKSTESAFYFAGTNGDFFDTSSPYPDGYNGYPIGGNIEDSQLTIIRSTWHVFAIDENKTPAIGYMTYSGNIKSGESVWKITSFNHIRGTNALVLYNQYNGKYTRTNSYGTEVLIELLPGNTWGINKTLHAKVVTIEKNIGNMSIPAGKAVLSGHGTSAANLDLLKTGDEIELNINMTLDGTNNAAWAQMTGGDNYATMLKDGVVETVNIWNERHPRTGIGYSFTGDTLIFCVVDGRSGVSEGVTTKELAEIMKSGGAYTAVNLDGGGSSSMYIQPYGGPVNAPSDGTERACGNSVFVVSTAPSDPVIGQIIPYESNIILPRYGEYIPQFYGYNQYGAFLDMDVQHVALSCDPSLGTIKGNKFTATGAQSGNITATFNNTVTTTIHVNILPVDDVKFLLDTVIVDKRSDYPVEVLATSNGNTVPIAASALSWTVDNPEICEITEGSVKALQNGMTWIHGTLGNMEDSLVVSVESPATNRVPMAPFQVADWTMTASSQLNAILNTDNLPMPWQGEGIAANFTFTAGRAPFIRTNNSNLQTFGLTDTVKVILNIGEAKIDKATVYLKPHNAKTTVSKVFTDFQIGDNELSIPLSELLDASDRTNYPLNFDNIYYQFLTSMNEGQAYTIALKEIVQIYKDISNTGIRQPQPSRFSVYPNPVTGKEINIRLEDGQRQTLQVEIYTLSGLKVQAKTLTVQGGMATFTRKSFPAGIYLLRIACDKQVETVKLIVR